MSPIASVLESAFQSVLWLSWQGTLLAAVVAAALLLMGNWLPARWRCFAWSLVVVRLLLVWGVSSPYSLYNVSLSRDAVGWRNAVASLQQAAPADPGSETPQEGDADSSRTAAAEPAHGLINQTRDADTPVMPAPVWQSRPQEDVRSFPPTQPAATVKTPTQQVARSPDRLVSVWTLLAAVWLAGAAVATVRLLLHQRRTSRLLAGGRDAPAEINELVVKLSEEAGLRRAPRVRMLAGEFGPAVSGLFRPVLYLPAWLPRELPSSQVGLVIRHELAHLKRWDVLLLWSTVAVRIVHWFNPIVRWALARWQRECELACDEYLLGQLDDRQRQNYGAVLLAVVERSIRPAPSPALLTFTRPSRHLKQRVETIVNFRRAARWKSALAAVLLMVLAVVGLTNAPSAVVADAAQSGAGPSKPAAAEPAPTGRPTPLNGAPAGSTQDAPAAPESATATDFVVAGVCKNESGAVIPGARVTLYWRENAVTAVKSLRTVGTDEAGRFRIRLSPQEIGSGEGTPRMMLVIQSERHNSQTVSIDPDELQADLKIDLSKRGKPLKGRVIDENGKQRPGVWVFFPNRIREPIPGALSGLTDEHGRFEIPDSPYPRDDSSSAIPGEKGIKVKIISYSLMAMHPDYPLTATQVKTEAEDTLIELAPGGEVAGRVVDEVTGRPAAKVMVSAQGVEDSGWYQTLTDERGRYRLLMVADRYNIWAAADDRMPIALDSVPVESGGKHAVDDIRLVKGGWVEGRLLDAESGQPIRREQVEHWPVRVAHYGPARPRSGAAVTSTEVGPDGRYRLRVAPGDNYVYVMSFDLGAQSRVVPVGDGETVELDFFARVKDPAKPTFEAPADEAAASAPERPDKPARERPKTRVGRLLRELAELQDDRQTGQIPWERKIRELILLGPDAVPDLIAALDATPPSDRLMLRSLPFVLRGIGDKRAVPALIRAIPRCYGDDGSDMGYRCEDEELLRFLQKHDNSDRDDADSYNYGRPVNEVFRTLEKWTGVTNGWHQLAFVSDGEGTPRQRQLKRQLFQKNAQRWAQWWEQSWHAHVSDPEWSHVNLPNFQEEPPVVVRVDRDKPLKRVSGRSNMIAQSVYNTGSRRTFYDLDTGRWSGLPARWRDQSREELERGHDAIVARMRAEGFDLMGTEIEQDGQRRYVLEAIDLEAWEIPMSFWRSGTAHTAQLMIEAGRPVERLLAHYDTAAGAFDHDQVGLFFYITNEGTPGRLYLGVEVKDTNLIPGPSPENDELNPKGFWEGRRFGLEILGEWE